MSAQAVSTSAPRPALLRAELHKATSTRMWLWLLGGTVLYVLLTVASNYFVALTADAGLGTAMMPTLDSEAGVRNVYASAGSGYLFALIIGILGMTQEFRFQTITATFLAAPRRGQVMLAKMAGYALLGAGYATVAVVFGYALSALLLTFTDHAPVPISTLTAIAGGTVLGYALYAVLGVAIGTLIRNQVAAIVGALVFTMLGEALLITFLPEIGKWLPGGALQSVLQATGITDTTMLAPWLGALLLLGYAAVIGAIATATTARRDIN